MAQKGNEIIICKGWWTLTQTANSLNAINEQQNRSIQYFLSEDQKFVVRSSDPFINLPLDNLNQFIELKNSLVATLKSDQQLPAEIEDALLSMVPTDPMEIENASTAIQIGPINRDNELTREFDTAISQKNVAHVNAIFDHYFMQKFSSNVQGNFWGTVPQTLAFCLKGSERQRYDSLDCFKVILEKCDQHIPRSIKENYDYGELFHAKVNCLMLLSLGESYNEDTAIGLSNLLLQEAESRTPIILQSAALNFTISHNRLKLFRHLLANCADSNAALASFSYGSRPIGAALGSCNFEAIAYLRTELECPLEISIEEEDDFRKTTFNMEHDNVISWIGAARRKASAMPPSLVRQTAFSAIRSVEVSLWSHLLKYKEDINLFKNLVSTACKTKSTTEKRWFMLIEAMKYFEMSREMLLFVMTDIATYLIDQNKIEHFKQLFTVLQKWMVSYQLSIKLTKDTLKAVTQLAYNRFVTEEDAADCIHLLFPTILVYPRTKEEWQSKRESVLVTLITLEPNILSLAASWGGHGLLKLLINVMKHQYSNFPSTNGKDALMTALHRDRVICATILFERFNVFFDLKYLEEINDRYARELNSEEFKDFKKKFTDLLTEKRKLFANIPKPTTTGYGFQSTGDSFFNSGNKSSFGTGFGFGSQTQTNKTSGFKPKATPSYSSNNSSTGAGFNFGNSQSSNSYMPPSTVEITLHPDIKMHLNTYGQKTPFESLGILPTKDLRMITNAYRALSMSNHPDKGNESNVNFQEINSAKTLLENETHRNDCFRIWGNKNTSGVQYSFR